MTKVTRQTQCEKQSAILLSAAITRTRGKFIQPLSNPYEQIQIISGITRK